MSLDSSPEVKCTQLSHDLEHYVNLALKAEFRNVNNELSSDLTTSLCNVVEAIFINGLKDPFYIKGTRHNKYPQPVCFFIIVLSYLIIFRIFGRLFINLLIHLY